MPSGSRLDHVYRSILMTKFFTKGWGKPENIKRLFAFRKIVSKRESCFRLVPKDYPITIDKDETHSDCRILEGKFLSPFVTHLPGLLPKEAETARFQAILPKEWESEKYKPICLHLAGTGDHGFWRRRQFMAKPLIKSAGIGSILLENPFYGLRKPKDQIRSSLHNVSDIFVMGGCLILESLALFHWCERMGLGPLGITGMSMGGHMASLAATNWPKPIVLVPCLSWSTASPVFTQGVMSGSINWNLLEMQYFSEAIFQDEIKKLVIKEDAFRAGQQFAKDYPESMDRINELHQLQQEEIKNESEGNAQVSLNVNHSQDYQCSKPSNTTEVSFMSSGIGISSPKTSICVKETEEIRCPNSSVILKGNSGESKMKYDANDDIISSTSMTSQFKSVPTNENVSSGLLSSLNFNLLSRFMGLQTKSQSELSVTPGVPSSGAVNKKAKLQEREAFHFMRGIMDECTHLSNFEVPVDTSLIIAICAKDDAYVPREGCADLAEIWPGAEVRFVDAGHVGAFLLQQPTFRGAIIECFERMRKKYPA